MSRYDDNFDGEDFPNQVALYRANVERALKGKRGRQALRDLRDALLALPEPRLIEGALCTVNPAKRAEAHGGMFRDSMTEELAEKGEGVCAIGAYLWHRKVKAGVDPAEAFDSLPTLEDSNYELHDTATLARHEAGMAYPLAWDLAYRNDETYRRMTPEERYTAFLAWIEAELGETAGSAS